MVRTHAPKPQTKHPPKSKHGPKNPPPPGGKRRGINAWTWRQYTVLGLIATVLALTGLSLGGAMNPAGGFLDWNPSSFNGFYAGSDQFSNAGQFDIADGIVNWHGRVQRGSLYYAGAQDLGWEQFGNTSVAVQILKYRGSILTYLQMRPSDVFPGLMIRQNAILGREFHYHQDVVTNNAVDSYLKANVLQFAGQADVLSQSVPLANVNDVLHATIGIDIQVDPTLIGQSFPTTFDDATQTYTLGGIWCGTLKVTADNAIAAESGLITQPGTTIADANFTNPGDPAWTSPDAEAKGLAAGTIPSTYSDVVGASRMAERLNADDPGHTSDHFRKSASTSTMFAGTDWEAAMGLGDPVTITTAAGASLSTSFEYGLLNDTTRNVVTAWVPLDLAPKTTVYQTTYTYNSFYTWDSWGLKSTTLLGRTSTAMTAITVQNPFIIQPFEVSVIVAANYTGTPLGCSSNPADPDYCANLGKPAVNGTGDVFNPQVTSKIDGAQGGGEPGLLEAILGFLGSTGGIIVLVVVVVVIGVVVYRYAKPRKGPEVSPQVLKIVHETK